MLFVLGSDCCPHSKLTLDHIRPRSGVDEGEMRVRSGRDAESSATVLVCLLDLLGPLGLLLAYGLALHRRDLRQPLDEGGWGACHGVREGMVCNTQDHTL